MPLETARAIDKLGFRRWYERQLIESHLWLVTALLCGFTILALFEAADFSDLAGGALSLLLIFVTGLVGVHGLRRYQVLMVLAGRLASQTTCPGCHTSGRFTVLDKSPRMRVGCRHCAREWMID